MFARVDGAQDPGGSFVLGGARYSYNIPIVELMIEIR